MNEIEEMRQEAIDASTDSLPDPEDIEETQPDDAREDALSDVEGRN